jgi:hypothetical protein
MTDIEKFELLKQDALDNYEGYINAIKNFSYNDIHTMNRRLDLLDAYNRSLSSNSAYRTFIINKK